MVQWRRRRLCCSLTHYMELRKDYYEIIVLSWPAGLPGCLQEDVGAVWSPHQCVFAKGFLTLESLQKRLLIVVFFCSPIWWNCRSGTVYKSDVRSTPCLLHQSWCHDSEGPRLPRCHREITLARMNRFNSNGSSALFMHSQTLTSLKLDFQSRGAETRGGGGCDVIMKVMKS